MERMQLAAHRWRLILFCIGGAVGAILLRDVLKALAVQVAAASALMLLALPVWVCLRGLWRVLGRPWP